MILLHHSNDQDERLLPQIMDAGGTLRIGRISTYQPAGAISYYRWAGPYRSSSDTGTVLVTNQAGEYPHHPCITAKGSTGYGIGAVEVFVSHHHSPNAIHIPALSKDSGGAITTSRSTYEDGYFRPLEMLSDQVNPPLHDITNAGYNVDCNDVLSQLGGTYVECNVERTPFVSNGLRSRLRASAWMLLLVKGQVDISQTKTFKFDVECWYVESPSGWHTRQAYMDASVLDVMQKNPTDASQGKYVLVKTVDMALEMEIPPMEYYEQYFFGVKRICAPRLKVNLSNGGRIDVMSWGFDVWPYELNA